MALLGVYVGLSLAKDPRAALGADSGGKIATLRAMHTNGAVDPDVGYWAQEYDRRGELHPLYYTRRIGDRWVQVTTLPMLVGAYPLYELGGMRAALLLPMLASVATAFGARALARRVGGGRGWSVFWAVGLATPVAVYALDFWEHAPGVALVVWAVVFLWDMLDPRAGWRRGWRGALVAGALFGAAATMRTEALVYAAVAIVVGAVVASRRVSGRSAAWAEAARVGASFCTAAAGVLVINEVLEWLVAGAALRSGRAASAVGSAGSSLATRVEEALTTTVGVNGFGDPLHWMVGALIVGAVAFAAWAFREATGRYRARAWVALAGAAAFVLARFGDGLGFVPGFLSASPLAVVGLAQGWSIRRWRPAGAVATAAVPLVWLFQYSGPANPQWGGRYLLASGVLLAVAGVIVLMTMSGLVRTAFVGLAACVTLAGVVWLGQRSHVTADAMRAITAHNDRVLIAEEGHFFREAGGFYTPARRWLTAVSHRQLDKAVRIADHVGAREIGLVAVQGAGQAARLGNYERGSTRRVELFPGVDAEVTTYHRVQGR